MAEPEGNAPSFRVLETLLMTSSRLYKIGVDNDIRNRPKSFTNFRAIHYTISTIKLAPTRGNDPRLS